MKNITNVKSIFLCRLYDSAYLYSFLNFKKKCSLFRFNLIFLIQFSFIFLSGCITEDIISENLSPNQNQSSPSSGRKTISQLPGYIGIKLFNIGSPSFRSDEDLSEENAFAPKESDDIYHHFMIVFDDEGQQKGLFPLDLAYATSNIQYSTVTISSIIKNSNEEIKTAAELISYLNGTKAYFLINVNQKDYEKDLSLYSEEELKLITVSDYSISVGGKEYFTMSNSTYLDGNNVVCAAEIDIDESKIFKTPEEVNKAINENPQNAIAIGYLERVAVKYTIEFNKDFWNNNVLKNQIKINVYDPIGDIQGRDLQIKVLGYGLGGLEQSSYLFKKITNENYYEEWNKCEEHRSLWSEDPNYDLNQKNLKHYPHQFRNTDDGTTDSIRSYDTSTAVLKYISFNEAKDNITKNIYTLENTYFDPGMKGGNWIWPWNKTPNSVATHLILACQASLEETLYKDKDGIFYTSEEDLLEAKLQTFNNISSYELWIYINNNSITEKATSLNLALSPANIPGGDGQSLIISENPDAKYYLLSQDPKEDLSNVDAVIINELFFELIGPIDTFTEGKMYYAMPIPHKVPHINEYSWKSLGDIGVVRNNWYDITIGEIIELGTAVHDPTQPIIPVLTKNNNIAETEWKPGEPSGIYLISEFNKWETLPDFQFYSTSEKNIWETKVVKFLQTDRFVILDSLKEQLYGRQNNIDFRTYIEKSYALKEVTDKNKEYLEFSSEHFEGKITLTKEDNNIFNICFIKL